MYKLNNMTDIGDGYTFALVNDEGQAISGVMPMQMDQCIADNIANRMLLGLNLFDITRTYVTGCGYPVRKLELHINSNLKLTVTGEFFGAEGFWMPRVWDGEGKEYLNGEVHNEMSLVSYDELAV